MQKEPLTLILGRAGSGKSRLVRARATQAIQQQKRVFILVPEQATYLTERALLEAQPNKSCAGSEVLSFARLCERVLSQTAGAVRPYLSKAGAIMALYGVLSRHQGELAVFSQALNSPPFVEQIYQQLCELRRYHVTPEQLRQLKTPRSQDFALLLTYYKEEVSARYLDEVGRMELATAQIRQAEFLHDAEILIDGFEVFTGQIIQLIAALLDVCGGMVITQQDGAPDGENDALFAGERARRRQLYALAAGAGRTVEEIVAQNFRQQSAALRHLERHLFAPSPAPFGAPQQQVDIFCAGHPQQEIEEVARRTAALVRGGMRYREIFVQLADESQTAIARTVFAEHGIPIFIDQKRPILQKAFCRFAMTFLKCAVYGQPQEDLIPLIQSGFFGLPPARAAACRTAMEEYNIRQLSARRIARLQPGQLQQDLQRIYETIAALTRALQTDMATCARAFYAALQPYEPYFLDYLQTLSQAPVAKQEERQAYEALLRLISDIEAILGEVSPGETTADLRVRFYQMLRAGAGGQEIAQIPATADCVGVGSVARSRAGDVRALFVVGAVDGLFPGVPESSAVLPEREKQRLREQGVWLGESLAERYQEGQLKVYGVLCKPKEYLSISYAKTDRSGNEQVPAAVVTQTSKMFSIVPANVPDYSDARPFAITKETLEAAAAKARGVSSADRRFAAYAKHAPLLLNPHKLGAEHTGVLFSSGGHISVSRVEQYAECPYRYFAQRALSLREKMQESMDARDRGTALHAVLQAFVAELMAREVPEQEIDTLAKSLCIEHTSLQSTPRNIYEQDWLCRQAAAACHAIYRQLQESAFVPVGTEHPFSAVREDGIVLQGTIDRIDLAQQGDKRYLRIFDYKSGTVQRMPRTINGTKLQLPIYAKAAAEAFDASLCGMYYLPVRGSRWQAPSPEHYRWVGITLDDEEACALSDGSEGQQMLPTSTASYLSPQQLAEYLQTAEDVLVEKTRQMHAGEVPPQPASAEACTYCTLQSICETMAKGGKRYGVDTATATSD